MNTPLSIILDTCVGVGPDHNVSRGNRSTGGKKWQPTSVVGFPRGPRQCWKRGKIDLGSRSRHKSTPQY